jgi:hypothetical protein
LYRPALLDVQIKTTPKQRQYIVFATILDGIGISDRLLVPSAFANLLNCLDV